MKTTLLNHVRKKGLLIFLFFVFLFAFESYAQYFGTSRRVARRTARRTSRRHAAYYGNGYGYGGGYGYGAPAGYVTTLPGGCLLRAISGINYQYCDGVYYRPYYEGTTVVYQVVEEDDL